MPCFEDLLPAPHNSIILNLLFDLATWHGYTKLQLHTEKMLKFFETAIVSLHQSVTTFQEKTSSIYYMTGLPQESAARGHQVTALAKKQGITNMSFNLKAKCKHLNLAT